MPAAGSRSKRYEMPASSSRRLTKAKSVSPYWTRYSCRAYVGASISKACSTFHSSSSLPAISGMERCWKMRLFTLWVSSHRSGAMRTR